MIDLKDFEQFARTHQLPTGTLHGGEIACSPGVDLADHDPVNPYHELLQRMFRSENKPEQPEKVLTLNGHAISTPGNLTVVAAKAKDGKTAVLGAMMAGAINPQAHKPYLLGFSSSGSKGRAVLHIDTEQSRYDHHQVGSRVLRRASLNDRPANFLSLFMTDLPITERLRLFQLALEMAAETTGGVYLILIDGVADLIKDPNNAEEAFAFTDQLHRLAIHYNCPIVCVLHENPGSDFGKTRGHLGSQLERKAETNVRLIRELGKTTICVEKGRHCFIPKEEGVRFEWSDIHQMHMPAETIKVEKERLEQRKLRECAVAAFDGQDETLPWKTLVQCIVHSAGLSDSGARKRLAKLVEKHVVLKNLDDTYSLMPEM